MEVTNTKLTDVEIVEMGVFDGHRGFLTENYSEAKLTEHRLDYDFVQGNHSLSAEAGVPRGLHSQKGEAAQTKLIRVVTGVVLDVVVNIHKDSPTHGQWDGLILSEHNHHQLLVPKGCAHGFVTLTPNMNFLYKCDNYCNTEADRGIAFDDPDLAIDWPVNPSKVIMSEKNHRHPTLREFKVEDPFVYGEI